MKRFMIIIVTLFSGVATAVPIMPPSGDVRVAHRGKTEKISKRSKEEMNQEIATYKKKIAQLNSSIRNTQHELVHASSIKGWSRKTINSKTRLMNTNKRAILDYQHKIADIKEELTTL